MQPLRLKHALALFTLALAVPLANAQDLLQIWQSALQRDPTYAAAQSARNAEQERVPQARAQLLPQIQAQAGTYAQDKRHASELNQGSGSNRNLWSLTLTQPVIDISRWRQLEQSHFHANSADVAQQLAYQDLILRVTQAYFDVLAAQDTLNVIHAQIRAAEHQLQSAQQSFALGGTTIADTHETQARLDLLQASEIQAQNALQVSRDRLSTLIYEPVGQLATLRTDTPLPPPQPATIDDWVTQAATANLDVLRADLDARIAENRISVARSGHYPTLSLQAQTGSASDNRLYPNNQGPRSMDSSIGLQLSIPLYSGGGISSEVREQTLRLQQARYQLEAAKRLATQSAQQYFSGVVSGLSQVRALSAAEASSRASLEANQLGYEVGVRVNIDVLNAQQQLYETQRNLARARYDTLMHGLRLKASSGALNESDIIAINDLLATSGAQSTGR